MCLSEPKDRSPRPDTRATVAGAGIVALLSTVVFAAGLASESSFVDEWAYLSQTYYADLWIAGNRNSAAWLEYPAYDLPPLPKYAFGLALRAGGFRRPGPEAARRWYRDTKTVCGSPDMLHAARWPAVAFGALGCVAIYGLGTLAAHRRVGFLAALFLMANPLYRLHAHRAMSDVIAESLILAAAVSFLWAWKRLLDGRNFTWPLIGAVGAGVATGLAALAKLNGGLAMIIIAAWALFALVLPHATQRSKLAIVAAALLAGSLSLVTFIAMNPFVTAHPRRSTSEPAARLSPTGRLRMLIEHRIAVSSGQKTLFPHNALNTLQDKLATVAVQGFGRFGPFGPRLSDSVQRFDRVQDWGAILWLPLVLAGAASCFAQGRTQLDRGEPPVAWAILVQAVVSLVVVTAYLPLAWDRYYLSLQPASALLAATAVATAGSFLWQTIGPRPAKA